MDEDRTKVLHVLKDVRGSDGRDLGVGVRDFRRLVHSFSLFSHSHVLILPRTPRRV